MLFVVLAIAARLGVTPDLTESENADVKTPSAFTASHRSAQDKKIDQVRRLKMRGTKIPGSAYVAMSNHHAFLLLLRYWGYRACLDYAKPKSTGAGMKAGKICCLRRARKAPLRTSER
jgi:hypothetical protein